MVIDIIKVLVAISIILTFPTVIFPSRVSLVGSPLIVFFHLSLCVDDAPSPSSCRTISSSPTRRSHPIAGTYMHLHLGHLFRVSSLHERCCRLQYFIGRDRLRTMLVTAALMVPAYILSVTLPGVTIVFSLTGMWILIHLSCR